MDKDKSKYRLEIGLTAYFEPTELGQRQILEFSRSLKELVDDLDEEIAVVGGVTIKNPGDED